MSQQQPFLVAIAGGTGAGKTTLAKKLAERYRELGATLMDQDSYYYDLSHLDERARAEVNFDDPAALDHDLLFSHLERLLAGEAVQKPRYAFAIHTRTGEFDRIAANPLIILEGLWALWDARVRALAGLKIYVEADADMRFIRRLRRDVEERGRTWESVVAQYSASVRPMHHLHVEPTRAFADLVFDTMRTRLEESLGEIEQALRRARPEFKVSVSFENRK
jgi:uridine kinase